MDDSPAPQDSSLQDQQVVSGFFYNDNDQVFLLGCDGLGTLAEILRTQVAQGEEVWIKGPRRGWEALLLIHTVAGDEVTFEVPMSRPGLLNLPIQHLEPLAAKLEQLRVPVHLSRAVRFDVRHREKRCAIATRRSLRELLEQEMIDVAVKDLPTVYARALAEINTAVHVGRPENALMTGLFECDEVEEIYGSDIEIRSVFNRHWKGLKDEQKQIPELLDPHADSTAFILLDSGPSLQDLVVQMLVDELSLDEHAVRAFVENTPSIIVERAGKELDASLEQLRTRLEELGVGAWYGHLTDLSWR
jgi:hypothetical protein